VSATEPEEKEEEIVVVRGSIIYRFKKPKFNKFSRLSNASTQSQPTLESLDNNNGAKELASGCPNAIGVSREFSNNVARKNLVTDASDRPLTVAVSNSLHADTEGNHESTPLKATSESSPSLVSPPIPENLRESSTMKADARNFYP